MNATPSRLQREDRHVVAAGGEEDRSGRQRDQDLGDAQLAIGRRAQQSRARAPRPTSVISDMMMRASVRSLRPWVAAEGSPNTPISGKYGKKLLEGRHALDRADQAAVLP